jgi:hypothetical protein
MWPTDGRGYTVTPSLLYLIQHCQQAAGAIFLSSPGSAAHKTVTLRESELEICIHVQKLELKVSASLSCCATAVASSATRSLR